MGEVEMKVLHSTDIEYVKYLELPRLGSNTNIHAVAVS